jgi:hypothetical protein
MPRREAFTTQRLAHIVTQPVHQLRQQGLQRHLIRCQTLQPCAGFQNKPAGIARCVKQLGLIDAGHTIQHPCNGNVLRRSRVAPVILVMGTAAVADRSDQPHNLTTCPVRTLSSAARTIRNELIASAT